MDDWASAFSNIGSKVFDGNNIANFGNLASGISEEDKQLLQP